MVELAQRHDDSAIGVLVEIMNDVASNPASRVAAAQALLDRGYGKSPQSVVLSGDPDNPVQHFVSQSEDLRKDIRGAE